MSGAPRFPLLVKVLGWLCLHLVILGLAFFLFVRWQLGLGLDSLLSGAAGERLADFGDSVVSRIVDLPPRRWNEEIRPVAAGKHVLAAVFDPSNAQAFPSPIPPNVLERARTDTPPQRLGGNPPPAGPGRPPRPPFDQPGGRPPPRELPDGEGPPPMGDHMEGQRGTSAVFLPKSRPAFLLRASNGDGYWAGVLLHLPPVRLMDRRPVMLLVRSDRLDGSGMFFDFKPWLWGGIAVLSLSIAFWTPFIWGISRYLLRLKDAADHIASGQFQVSLPHRGNDELGDLGRSIESMAARLDHLVSGQKRFLGDAAHELCAPLARIRTGLGILEMKLTGADSSSLASIEADTAELAALVNEILAFSRAGNRSPSVRSITLDSLVREVIVRESVDVDVVVSIPANLTVLADPSLLGRAIGNLLRNSAVHAGSHATVRIEAAELPDSVEISVADNGPGVPASELPRVFEPFYRIDRSRSRDTGGSGLGLAIVRTATEACGGTVAASLPESGGFRVTLSLPRHGG